MDGEDNVIRGTCNLTASYILGSALVPTLESNLHYISLHRGKRLRVAQRLCMTPTHVLCLLALRVVTEIFFQGS